MPCLCEDYGGICRCFERQRWPFQTPLWGDEYAEAELEMLRNETPGAKAARLAADAAADAARETSAEAYKMAIYAEIQGVKNLRSVPGGRGRDRQIGKIDSPCRWLYCNEAAPKSQWTINAKKELCAPVLKALTGSQCWAHEYLDPKSKQLKKPHTCKHLHPGEDGWRHEWDADRCWKPTAAEGFCSQRMVQTPTHAQKPSAW